MSMYGYMCNWYVFVCVCECKRVSVGVYVHMCDECMCTHVGLGCVYMHVCIYMHVYMRVCGVWMCIYTCIYMHVFLHYGYVLVYKYAYV